MAKKPSTPSKPAKAKPAEKKPAAAAASSGPDLTTQQAKAWAMLCKISTARRNAKSRETELIATRKDLDSQLDQLGAGSTPRHMEISREYVVCVRSIKFQRARIQTLADKFDTIMEEAAQGKLDPSNFPTDAELFHRVSEEDLFTPAEDEDGVEGQLTIGGVRDPLVPDQPGLDGPEETDQHLKAPIEELDLPDHIKAKLYKSGYRIIDALVRIVDDPEQDLMTVLNCDDEHAKAIRKSLGEFRSRHRKAMSQAEKDAAAELARKFAS